MPKVKLPPDIKGDVEGIKGGQNAKRGPDQEARRLRGLRTDLF